MWKDAIEKRFFWAALEQEIEKLLYELIKAEEEEDSGIYLLMMHYDHARQKNPFSPEENERIVHLLSVLIGDSKKHQRLLQDAISQIEKRSGS